MVANLRGRLGDREVDEPIARGEIDPDTESIDADIALLYGSKLPLHPTRVDTVDDDAFLALEDHADDRMLDIPVKENLEIDIETRSRIDRRRIDALVATKHVIDDLG